MRRDLHLLPRVEDGLTFLYADHCRVEVCDGAVVLMRAADEVAVPVAALSALLLGPGTAVTQAAVAACAAVGASLVWCGDGAVRCYAACLGETRGAENLEAQARYWADSRLHLQVAKAMYAVDALARRGATRSLHRAPVRDGS